MDNVELPLLYRRVTNGERKRLAQEVLEKVGLSHRLNKEDGRTIVMVTHNEEQAKQTSRTIRFFDGRQVR